MGKFMWQHGGTEREYEMAMRRDPFKRQSLERLEAIEKLLRQIRDREGGYRTLPTMDKMS